MQCAATIEHPKVLTRPWNISRLLYRRKEPNAQAFDYQCYAFGHDKKGLSIKGLSIPSARVAGPRSRRSCL